VEFHDFLDSSSLPAILAVIAKLRSIGFWAVKFSWSSYGDVLFVNQAYAPLSLVQKLWIIAVHKYGRGLGRILGTSYARFPFGATKKVGK
jgi:hypothetical protein